MLTDSQAQQLKEANEFAYFRAECCLMSPESYSLEEKQAICQEMDKTNEAIDQAIRDEFFSMPEDMQKALYQMLTKYAPELKDYWDTVLTTPQP